MCFRPTIVQHSKLPGTDPRGSPGSVPAYSGSTTQLQRREDARGPSWSLNAHLPTLSQQRRVQGTSELPPPPSRQASGRMEKKHLPQLEQEDRARPKPPVAGPQPDPGGPRAWEGAAPRGDLPQGQTGRRRAVMRVGSGRPQAMPGLPSDQPCECFSAKPGAWGARGFCMP